MGVFKLTEEYYYTEEELARIFQYLKNNFPEEYYFFKVLFLTGRRVAEILGGRYKMDGMCLRDINFEGNFINFQIGKKFRKDGERIRENIKVSKEVIDLIKEYCEKYRVTDPKEKVFRHTRSWYYKILKKTLNALGIKKKRILHGFRHSFGIFGVKEGTTTEDLLRLQKLMAHSNIQTTIEYAKIKEMGEQELAEKISKRLKEIHSSI